jgi:hypothetical protein
MDSLNSNNNKTFYSLLPRRDECSRNTFQLKAYQIQKHEEIRLEQLQFLALIYININGPLICVI